MITLRISDDELARIDAAAGANNRTLFMLNASREAVARVERQQLDAEVGRILAEHAEEDLEILRDWTPTMADGIE